MSKFKPGLRCMIVESQAGNVGKIVTLVRFVGYVIDKDGICNEHDNWEVEELVNWVGDDGSRGQDHYAYEGQLMPLDGSELEIPVMESEIPASS